MWTKLMLVSKASLQANREALVIKAATTLIGGDECLPGSYPLAYGEEKNMIDAPKCVFFGNPGPASEAWLPHYLPQHMRLPPGFGLADESPSLRAFRGSWLPHKCIWQQPLFSAHTLDPY